jgi:uncharacterized protein YecE (DUF72 family)
MDRGRMLDFYAREFDTVEVNSSYYRVMHPRVSEAMARKTPDGFQFFLKLHESMTHSRDASDDTWRDFSAMLRPFSEAGKLSGLLAQFPYSFRPSEDAFGHLSEILRRVEGIPLAVEYRNSDWFTPEPIARTTALGAAPVSVDAPALRGLPPRETVGGGSFGYFRFHGRNAAHWWEGGPLRYDYEYSEEELSGWKPGIRSLLERSGRVFLFFNNCHMGQAVRSARLMKSLLEEMER